MIARILPTAPALLLAGCHTDSHSPAPWIAFGLLLAFIAAYAAYAFWLVRPPPEAGTFLDNPDNWGM